MKSIIKIDENGKEWLATEEGDFILDEKGRKISPSSAPASSWKESSGFSYCDAPGYCALCGSKNCSGTCFK